MNQTILDYLRSSSPELNQIGVELVAQLPKEEILEYVELSNGPTIEHSVWTRFTDRFVNCNDPIIETAWGRTSTYKLINE